MEDITTAFAATETVISTELHHNSQVDEITTDYPEFPESITLPVVIEEEVRVYWLWHFNFDINTIYVCVRFFRL